MIFLHLEEIVYRIWQNFTENHQATVAIRQKSTLNVRL